MPSQVERYASLQVVAGSYKLMIARISCLPPSWRRKLYKSYVDSLTDTAFDMYGGQVIKALSFSRGMSHRLNNTERELEVVLRWLPRLEKYRGILREQIHDQRKKYGLKT